MECFLFERVKENHGMDRLKQPHDSHTDESCRPALVCWLSHKAEGCVPEKECNVRIRSAVQD
jgi:hypothetical protein